MVTIFEVIIKLKKIPLIQLPEKKNQINNKGEIRIGEYYYNNGNFENCYLSLEDFKRHLLIYGQTGSGKTTFLKKLLINFGQKFKEIPFLIFEFKGEFDDLIGEIPDIEIYKPGKNFFLNIFNSRGIDIKTYAEFLFDMFKSCRIITDTGEFSPQMEFVMVEVLKKTCLNPDQANWSRFIYYLDKFEKLNSDKYPQLSQTIISIKNRLRRYVSGSLNPLFENKEHFFQIEELMKKKMIIDLGILLEMGGNKEDVILFANIILKWFWDFNIHNKASNYLKHITIFEDVSYIASKKLLESSKLTSYLEDIALLLRGKGEGLICLTTTLDISKNIIVNAGSKFFFKFNEKPEDALYLLGIAKEISIDINQLRIGFCIAKIYSINNPILLGVKQLTKKKKRLNQNNNEKINLEKINNQPEISLSLEDNKNKSQKKEIQMDFNLFKGKLQNIKDLYIIDDFENCIRNLKEIYEDIFYFELNKIDLDCDMPNMNILNLLYENKPRFDQKIQYFIPIYEKILNISKNDQIQSNSLNIYIKLLEDFVNINLIKISPNEFDNKIIQKDKEQDIGLILNYFDSINGMDNFYEIGALDIKLKNKIEKILNSEDFFFKFQIEEYLFLIFTFEINSDWARGKKELIQLISYYSNKKAKSPELLHQIFTNFVEELKNTTDLFKAFYISSDYMKTNHRKEIQVKNYELKHQLKGIYEEFQNEIIPMVSNSQINNYDTIEINKKDLDELNYYIESLLNNQNFNRI